MTVPSRRNPCNAPRTERARTHAAVAGCVLLCGFAALDAPPASAQTARGLVIGINEYVELAPLGGAVNDARDIQQALAGAGVGDIVMLLNAEASRERIETEWRALVARSVPGDTLVLTYAGHGGQEEARFPETEEDRKDETLLLGGFRESGEGTRERIVDDELNQWFVEAGARDLRVIFVADSCHSGTMTRQMDSRAPPMATRKARYTLGEDLLMLTVDEETAALDHVDLPHVSFLSAGQDDQEVPELPLANAQGSLEPRGVLSFHFARALEGDADWDGDGVLRRDELWRFVRANVQVKTDSLQVPNLLPESDAEVLLRLSSPPRVAPPDEVPALRLQVLHSDPATLAALDALLEGVRIVSHPDAPDLIWDAAAREVLTGRGDMAAYEVGLADLQSVVDKWRAVRAIAEMSARASLELSLYPNDETHRSGEVYSIEVDGLRQPQLILIMLSAKGRVHYLSRPEDQSRITPGRPFPAKILVEEPFGADHIVAVSAESSIELLDIQLERLDDQRAARRVVELLADASAGATGWWSGVKGLFSIP